MAINVYGAYTRLRDNSKSAMMAAIEIYNKPNFDYRDECCAILLINAWELILKALLSKNRVRIYYYKKRRGEEFRTFSLSDSLRKVEPFFPEDLEYLGVKSNLEHLVAYRNKAIHFYNVKGFSSIIYNLAQASIKNYSDLLRQSFGVDMANEMNIFLLPLSLGRMPLDPIEFLNNESRTAKYPDEVAKFIANIGSAITELDAENVDVSRLMVTFSIRFESVKKAKDADAVVAVDNNAPVTAAVRKFDPNDFLRQKEILKRLPKDIGGIKVNQRTFQALVWKRGIKDKQHLCWSDKSGAVTRYSPELIGMIRNASSEELRKAREEYSLHLARRG